MRTMPTMPKPTENKLKKRILVIENDPELRYILSLIFDDENFEYQMFSETFDIVALAMAYQPDLVLLDFRLPLINGGELCLQLKRTQETCRIPVMIYSAAPNVFHSVKNYHQDLFLAKPFDLNDLLNKIKQLTAHKMQAG